MKIILTIMIMLIIFFLQTIQLKSKFKAIEQIEFVVHLKKLGDDGNATDVCLDNFIKNQRNEIKI